MKPKEIVTVLTALAIVLAAIGLTLYLNMLEHQFYNWLGGIFGW